MENLAKQLKELKIKFINKIIDNEYKVYKNYYDSQYFNLHIHIDTISFTFSIPENLEYIVEHFQEIKLFSIDEELEKEIAKIFFERHFEKIRVENIESEILQLEKKLKTLKNEQ